MDSDRTPSPGAVADRAATRALRPHPDVLTQMVGDTTVLVDLHSNRIFELNATAGDLWRLLDAGSDPDAAVRTLVERYDAPAELIRSEVQATLETLAAQGLLVPHSGE